MKVAEKEIANIPEIVKEFYLDVIIYQSIKSSTLESDLLLPSVWLGEK